MLLLGWYAEHCWYEINSNFFQTCLLNVCYNLSKLKNWSSKQFRDWIYPEIRQFLEIYVFLYITELKVFVNAMEELRVLNRTGYSCRECGKSSSFTPLK